MLVGGCFTVPQPAVLIEKNIFYQKEAGLFPANQASK
jgi:hypothetical protein